MKIKYLDGTLSVEMLKELSDFVSQDGAKILYIALDGGSIGYADTMIDIIHNAENMSVVGTNRLYSAGFYIFAKINTEKHLAKGTRGMWHQGRFEADIRNDGKLEYISDKFNLNIHKEQYTSVILHLAKKLGMTDKEIKKIKKGKDVYFTYERMKEMFG